MRSKGKSAVGAFLKPVINRTLGEIRGWKPIGPAQHNRLRIPPGKLKESNAGPSSINTN